MLFTLRFARPIPFVLACLMSALVTACTSPIYGLGERSAALCANAITENFHDTLVPREGDVVCVEGYLGRSTTFDFVAIAAERSAEDETRRVLLVADDDLSHYQTASRIRAIGTVARPSGCHEEGLQDDSPCWDGSTNVFLEVYEVQIEARNYAEEGCQMAPIDLILKDPLQFAYQYICADGIVRIQGDMINILPARSLDDLENHVIDWGALREYNFQSGVQIHLEGLLVPDESCVGPQTLCLFTPRPFEFTDATATLSE